MPNKLRTEIKLGEKGVKGKLGGLSEKVWQYKIMVHTKYSHDYCIGYLEANLEPDNFSSLIVSRLYVYKLYRDRGYLKKAADSVFKELFIRHYSVSKLKVMISEEYQEMKRILLFQGFKLHESKSLVDVDDAKLVYSMTREEMRKLHKTIKASILQSKKFKELHSYVNEEIDRIKSPNIKSNVLIVNYKPNIFVL